MSKVDNLKKALDQIDAKAKKLAYARQQIEAKLEASAKIIGHQDMLDTQVSGVVPRAEVVDATPVQQMDSVGAGDAQSDGYTCGEVLQLTEGYLAQHSAMPEVFVHMVKMMHYFVPPDERLTFTQIWPTFVAKCGAFGFPVAGWEQEDLNWLRDFLDVCFHVSPSEVTSHPEGSTGYQMSVAN